MAVKIKKIEDVDLREVARHARQVKKLKMPSIQTMDFVYDETAADEASEVTYEYPELTALCPMTGIQDLYTVWIIYTPRDKIPELKSLRFYFLAYRDVAVFHEHLAEKIFRDFQKAVKPKRLRLELEAAVRGGLRTKIVKSA